MSIKNLSAALILILCAFAFAFAQDKKPKNDDYLERQRQQREQDERLEKAKRDEKPFVVPKVDEFLDLDFFLPAADDGWTFSVLATGGVFGGTRLLAAVNSDGNFLCTPKDAEFKSKLVAKPIFQIIAQLAAVDFPRLNSIKTNPPRQSISYCSDCARETLTVVRRAGQTVETFHYDIKDLAASEHGLREIYEKVLDSAECR